MWKWRRGVGGQNKKRATTTTAVAAAAEKKLKARAANNEVPWSLGKRTRETKTHMRSERTSD